MTLSANPGDRGVCLVGFMGAGKTSVGRVLAHRLGWKFIDLDDVVEARERRRIVEIFREAGEPAFRQAESSALRDVLSRLRTGPLVIAVGGGAFVQPENVGALRRANLPVVFLDAPLRELRRRCAPTAAERPLFRDENQFRQLYEARRDSYMRADLRIETTGRTVEQVASAVVKSLGFEGA